LFLLCSAILETESLLCQRAMRLNVLASLVAAAPFQLVAHLSHKNPEILEELFWNVSSPGNPEYLRFRTTEEIAAVVGSAESEIEEVKKWLVTKGADPSSLRLSPLRDSITADFDGLALGWEQLAKKPAAVEFVHRRDFRSSSMPEAKSPARDKPNEFYTISNMKKAYGIPEKLLASNDKTLQMVWGPGTFGFDETELSFHKLEQCPLLNVSRVVFDTPNHGKAGGDNFGEGNLDAKMIASFGLNVRTLVSNTNASASTEEGEGFGQALLDFVTEVATRDTLPQVLSMSLGSLGAYACDTLCSEAVKKGFTMEKCRSYLQDQRQVCMFLSQSQTDRINSAFKVLGTRGVTLFGASGDGGSHFSFGSFEGGDIADALNTISCDINMPVYPTASPYVVSVGGTMWSGDSSNPVTWAGFGGGSGGGFSWQFAAPVHQKEAVAGYLNATTGLPPQSSYNAAGRAYPDVSAIGVQGTSQSCPIMAGIFSLLMDHRLNQGLPPLGFVAPRIWQVASQYPGEAFQDVTEGNTKTSCSTGFPATKGWDPNTGWGRPIWAGMLKHFGSDAASEIVV